MSALNPVTMLTEDECWELLKTQHVGRLVTRVGDIMDIVPLNYVVDGNTIVFRTGEGTKLSELVVNHEVLFEADSYDSRRGWSVVLRGSARRIQKMDEILDAEELPLRPMVATLKMVFVRIQAHSLTGRSFHFGAEPDRSAVQPG